jgi:beta-phosphoglucomutase-like phosphatase (HAD superfamily)
MYMVRQTVNAHDALPRRRARCVPDRPGFGPPSEIATSAPEVSARAVSPSTRAGTSTVFPEDEIRAQAANLAFERSFQAAVDRFGALPRPGANDALAKLAAAGIKLCLMSCLSRPAFSLIMERLGWWQRGDLILCADDVPRGFPWPDLVLTAILRLGLGDVRDVAVVTASEGGVLCAHRAGARLVLGVLSDVDDGRRLRRAGATHLLADIGELPDLLAGPA